MRLFLKEKNFQKFQTFLQKMFRAFWAWDMAPTWADPCYFSSEYNPHTDRSTF